MDGLMRIRRQIAFGLRRKAADDAAVCTPLGLTSPAVGEGDDRVGSAPVLADESAPAELRDASPELVTTPAAAPAS